MTYWLEIFFIKKFWKKNSISHHMKQKGKELRFQAHFLGCYQIQENEIIL